MHTKMPIPSQALSCPPGTIPGGLTRTRFFDGMFLTQADLENEQVYWRMKRRLTNRALGTGVVWGLRLTYDFKAQTYKLSPGYALDCCGNDLVVECPVQITQSELYKRSQAALGTPALGHAMRAPTNTEEIIINRHPASIVLQYTECPDAIRPVHRDACTPSGSSCEPSRIRESCRLLLVPLCSDRTGCDPVNNFAKKMDKIRGKLGVKPEDKAADAWLGNATYKSGKQTIGSWLAFVMHGYLATADKYDASAQSRLIVAYLLKSVMAGLLDIDMTSIGDDVRGELSIAVNEMSQDLCTGLLYPGPRCHDEHHGVYLGSVLMSLGGGVEFFDEWACRREVLTGPLLNWWLCQFGAVPLDILVNDVARASCDAAATNNAEVMRLSDQLTDVVDNQVNETRALHPLDFLTTIARTATGVPAGSGLVKVEAIAPNGLPMSVVVPASAVATSDTSSAAAALAHSNLVAGAVPALSRSPLRDLITELAARTPVSAVATGIEPDAVKPLGTMTVSELLAAEPEAVLVKIGGAKPTDAQRAAVNQLYLSAESFVRDATTATSAAGKAGVTRAQLKSAELKAALKKVPGVTPAAIDAAAAAAAKR